MKLIRIKYEGNEYTVRDIHYPYSSKVCPKCGKRLGSRVSSQLADGILLPDGSNISGRLIRHEGCGIIGLA